MARDEKLDLLATVPLFARMGGKELERLGQLADEVEVGMDEFPSVRIAVLEAVAERLRRLEADTAS